MKKLTVNRVVPKAVLDLDSEFILKLEQGYVVNALTYEVAKRYPIRVERDETFYPRRIVFRGEAFDPVSVFEELDKLRERVAELEQELEIAIYKGDEGGY